LSLTKEWTIVENEEYLRTIKLVPKHIRDKIENELKPQMKEYPFTNDADRYHYKMNARDFMNRRLKIIDSYFAYSTIIQRR
jgi:hypothetical protein